jgi:hypothetical protein
MLHVSANKECFDSTVQYTSLPEDSQDWVRRNSVLTSKLTYDHAKTHPPTQLLV